MLVLMLALALGLGAVVPLSATADDDITLMKILDLVSQDSPRRVAFAEERHLSFLTEPLRLSGELAFDPPDRLERVVLRPKKEIMEIEGDLLSLRTLPTDPSIRVRLADYPALQAMATALRGLLAGNQAVLSDAFQVTPSGTAENWSLRLEPLSGPVRAEIAHMELTGVAGQVQSLEIFEAAGDRTRITFQSLN